MVIIKDVHFCDKKNFVFLLEMVNATEHFDIIAKDYDYWKRKNWYYHESLKKLLREYIQPAKAILEIGCGTGEILVSLEPAVGVGIDTSQEMVKLAKYKYGNLPNVSFHNVLIEEFATEKVFDFIILVDVIEHLKNVSEVAKRIVNFVKPNTKVIISMANPYWEPILLFLEKIKLKMPEGEHKRISCRETVRIFSSSGLVLEKHDFRLLVPFFIPFIADFVNCWFRRIPILKRFGLIEYMVFGRRS